jgi:hypothetical protein
MPRFRSEVEISSLARRWSVNRLDRCRRSLPGSGLGPLVNVGRPRVKGYHVVGPDPDGEGRKLSQRKLDLTP